MIHIPTEKLADFEKTSAVNDHDQWNRRIRGRLHHRCLQPDTSGISDCQSASPVERYLVFSKTNEKLTQGTHVYNLETSQHAGKGHSPIRTQGQRFLTDFSCDGTVCFSYAAGNIRMDKHLACCGNQTQLRSPIRLQTRRGSRTFHHPAYEFPGAQCIVCRF